MFKLSSGGSRLSGQLRRSVAVDLSDDRVAVGRAADTAADPFVLTLGEARGPLPDQPPFLVIVD